MTDSERRREEVEAANQQRKTQVENAREGGGDGPVDMLEDAVGTLVRPLADEDLEDDEVDELRRANDRAQREDKPVL